jgi:hypothetical protein
VTGSRGNAHSKLTGPATKRWPARGAIAIVLGILALALLAAQGALALPAGLTAVTGQPRSNHPTYTWCKLARLESLFVETATADEVGVGGHFLQKNLTSFNVVGKQDTTFTDEYEFQPGTYYVHVGTHDPGSSNPNAPIEYSNVLSFTVLAGPHVTSSTAPCPQPSQGGGGGGASDKTAPVVELSFPRIQRIAKLYVKVHTSENATIKATGTLSARTASRVYRFKPKRVTLSGNSSTKVPLRLSKKNLRAVKRALRGKRRLKAKVTVTATDAAGNRRTKKVTLKVKR